MARSVQATVDIWCKLGAEFFENWDTLSEEQQAVFKEHKTKCEGSGVFGPACLDCHFCEDYDWENFGC